MAKKTEFIIFNPEGGLGKIIASTAVVRSIKAHYPDKKIIVVTPWPEVFLNNPHVWRVFRSGNQPYFYKDYIQDRETLVFKGEPYFNTGHLYNRQHVVKSWCELHNVKFDGNYNPELYFTPAEIAKVQAAFQRPKPICLLQTNGGMYNHNPQHHKHYAWARDLPHNQAQILANELSKLYTVLHITKQGNPDLANTERIQDMDKRSLMLLPAIATKACLIDSCLQHAAAALGKKSTVAWIATHPEVFGYDLHTNVKPCMPFNKNQNTAYIDSILFDYDFNGPEHEFPFAQSDIFNLQEIFDSIVKEEVEVPAPTPEEEK